MQNNNNKNNKTFAMTELLEQKFKQLSLENCERRHVIKGDCPLFLKALPFQVFKPQIYSADPTLF